MQKVKNGVTYCAIIEAWLEVAHSNNSGWRWIYYQYKYHDTTRYIEIIHRRLELVPVIDAVDVVPILEAPSAFRPAALQEILHYAFIYRLDCLED